MTRTGRCVCGLRVELHFDVRNRKLSCEETRLRHPRAHGKRSSLYQQFIRVVPRTGDSR